LAAVADAAVRDGLFIGLIDAANRSSPATGRRSIYDACWVMLRRGVPGVGRRMFAQTETCP
jgi:hypothetical protein